MPSKQHQEFVRKLVEAGASTHKFQRSVFAAIKSEDDPELVADISGLLKDRGIVPDAFHIDHTRQIISAFEVEVAKVTPPHKLERYVDLWWILDELEWDLRLIVVKGIGHLGVCYEIDLLDAAYATLGLEINHDGVYVASDPGRHDGPKTTLSVSLDHCDGWERLRC